MSGTRAVLLGFAGMALALIGGTALFAWTLLSSLAGPPPDAAESQAVNQVFRAKKHTFDPVHGIEHVLPIGARWSDAAIKLSASRFDCKAAGSRAICARNIRIGPCGFERHIDIALSDDGRISSVSATETPVCL